MTSFFFHLTEKCDADFANVRGLPLYKMKMSDITNLKCEWFFEQNTADTRRKKTELVCLCVVSSPCPQDPDPPEIKPRNFSPERKSRQNEMTNLSQGTIHMYFV